MIYLVSTFYRTMNISLKLTLIFFSMKIMPAQPPLPGAPQNARMPPMAPWQNFPPPPGKLDLRLIKKNIAYATLYTVIVIRTKRNMHNAFLRQKKTNLLHLIFIGAFPRQAFPPPPMPPPRPPVPFAEGFPPPPF